MNQPIYLLAVMAVLLAACTTTALPTATSFPPTLATTTPSLGKTSTPEAESTQPADVIFYYGMILTMEASQPLAQAIAIGWESILAMGPNIEILVLKTFPRRLLTCREKLSCRVLSIVILIALRSDINGALNITGRSCGSFVTRLEGVGCTRN